MSERGKIKASQTSKGKRKYELAVWHRGLNLSQVISGTSPYEVEQRALKKMAQWDAQWERQQRAREVEQKKRRAIERTQEAQESLSYLEHILSQTLEIEHPVDWESLKDHSDYPTPKPKKPAPPKIDPVSRLVPSFRRNFERRVKEQEEEYAVILAKWEKERTAYLKERDKRNAAIEAKKEKYLNGDPEAVIEYCDMVLSNSEYPEYFPQSHDLDYNPEGGLLIVDYQLPPVDSIPTVREVKYVQTRDEFDEKNISQSELNRRYDSLLYQIPLRTLHELVEADKADALSSIVFNGYVRSIDPATGHEVNPCVLSIQASKDEFEQINLGSVDPKACFRNLKGVGSSKLHSLTPIAPILRIEREDARFVSSYAVVDALQEGDNLAAMDWEDFEHLIRELFEEEFAASGGEVKVTRASRDGGVDAVAFDPDPIRGGKIVIQAKRYTGTVGVSFVRDLYGTVLNEGAIKGILVTTANYGPDAYEFAKDKPLTLLNGGNLLHLLEKHGHRARIDTKEAKRILAERERS
jgi:restriction system protein